MTCYVFTDVEAFHRIVRREGASELDARCQLPIGSWQCIFKDVNGIIYNANTDSSFTRINQ